MVHIGCTGDQGAFRVLAHSYMHWSSSRLEEMDDKAMTCLVLTMYRIAGIFLKHKNHECITNMPENFFAILILC